MARCSTASSAILRVCLSFAICLATSWLGAQEAQPAQPPQEAQAPQQPREAPQAERPAVAPEYLGWTTVARDQELSDRFSQANALLAEKDWEAGLRLLVKLLDVPADAETTETATRRWVSEDGVLLRTPSQAVRQTVRQLPEEAKAVWERVLDASGRAAPDAPRAAGEPESAPGGAGDAERHAPSPDASSEWRSVMGRYDHAALDIPASDEARLGGYASWRHRFGNYRELKSSDAKKNPYYLFYQQQVVTLEDLLFVRSHQDVVALDRETGKERWRVDSDQPDELQTHNSSSGFHSWRYFTDIGGWALSLVTGPRGSASSEQLVVIDLSGRPTRSGEFRYVQKSQLRSYDPRTGAPLWTLGGEKAEEEALRELSFAAPPTPVTRGDSVVLVAPAMARSGYHLAGVTPEGKLLWLQRIYELALDRKDAADGIYQSALAHGASLAAREGVCVAAPGHGVIAAVDSAGEILWLSRYRSTIRNRGNEPAWAPGHPLISGRTVVVAPFDSDYLIALDLTTGRTLWDRQVSGYSLLLGADAERCFTLDRAGQISAWSLADGSIAWKSDPAGAPMGRGLVTRSRIYVATRRAVSVYRTENGQLIETSALPDSEVPDPAPGNLFVSRGALFFAAPWGVARLEDYDATLARVKEFPLREQRLVRARILRQRGEYAEALAEFQKALSQSARDDQRQALRAELLEVAREAAAKTRDVGVIRRILESPDLTLTSGERTAFLLRSAESLAEVAPESVASTYRRLVDEASPGVLSLSPDGFLVNPGLYASDCLRQLLQDGRIEPDREDEERVSRWIRECTGERIDPARAAELMLSRAHVLAAAGAHAFLARRAVERGDYAEARQYLLRLEADYPGLGHLVELRRTIDARARSPEERSPSRVIRGLDEPPTENPWSLHFDAQGRPGHLVTTAAGSDPLPGVLALEDGTLTFYDLKGEVVSRRPLEGFDGLEEARSKLESTLLEPCVAFVDPGAQRMLLNTPVGLFESIRPGSAAPRVRSWFRETHPLARRWNETAGADARRQVIQYSAQGVRIVSTVERFGTIPSDTCFYTRVCFTREGDPVLLEPDGSVTGFEGRTGRVRYRAESGVEQVAGLEPGPDDHTFVVAASEPPQLVLHDLRSGSRRTVPASAPPWRWALVPGIAVVLDTAVGLEVRQMLPFSGASGDEEKPHYALWRDAEPHESPSLVHADARGVIVLEADGHVVSRELRSGRLRWRTSAPVFREGATPLRVYEVGDTATPEDEIVIVAARGALPWVGRDVLSARSADDLFAARLSLDGEVRWTKQLAAGKVACGGRRILLGREWGFAYNLQENGTWKTRVVALGPERGEARTLIDHELPAANAYPAPRVLLTTEGIAVGNLGAWAWYSPRPKPAEPEQPAEQAEQAEKDHEESPHPDE